MSSNKYNYKNKVLAYFQTRPERSSYKRIIELREKTHTLYL